MTTVTMFERIDRVLDVICLKQAECAQTGTEALAENNEELSILMEKRHDQLDLRYERVMGIAAQLSAN